jgi:hypothetical protein
MTTALHDLKQQVKKLSGGGLVRLENEVVNGEVVFYFTIDWTGSETAEGKHLVAIEKLRLAGFEVKDKTYVGKSKYNKGIRFGKCVIIK